MENLKKSEDGKRKEKKYIKTKNKFSVQEDEMKKITPKKTHFTQENRIKIMKLWQERW